MSWFLKALSRVDRFKGRSCRAEYWIFTLVVVMLYLAGAAITKFVFDGSIA